MKAEKRILPLSLAGVEVRQDGDDGPKTIHGYAAVYYDGTPATEFVLWGDIRERIMPGAFDGVMDDDVRSLFNHDENMVLGRCNAGTLAISLDDRGLSFDVTPPSARGDVLEAVERGDVTGASFMFSLARDKGGEVVWRENDEGDIREIVKVAELFDVGPVTFPAYEATAAQARDITAAQGEYDRMERERREHAQADERRRADADAIAVQCTLLRIRR